MNSKPENVPYLRTRFEIQCAFRCSKHQHDPIIITPGSPAQYAIDDQTDTTLVANVLKALMKIFLAYFSKFAQGNEETYFHGTSGPLRASGARMFFPKLSIVSQIRTAALVESQVLQQAGWDSALKYGKLKSTILPLANGAAPVIIPLGSYALFTFAVSIQF